MKTILVDNEPLMQQKLETVMKDIREVDVVGSFGNSEKALEYADLKGEETVWDLYCGIGTISLFLARKAGQVYGVEIVPEAVEDAQKNAHINGIRKRIASTVREPLSCPVVDFIFIASAPCCFL